MGHYVADHFGGFRVEKRKTDDLKRRNRMRLRASRAPFTLRQPKPRPEYNFSLLAQRREK